MTDEYKVLGDVAVSSLANPPLNGLGFSTHIGIINGLFEGIRQRRRPYSTNHPLHRRTTVVAAEGVGMANVTIFENL